MLFTFRTIQSLKFHPYALFTYLRLFCFLQICPPLLNNQELVLYLRKTCQSKRTSTNHFCHFENKLQYYLIKLAQIHVSGS